MKKTTAITLTLLTAAALAACEGRRSERVLAGYRDPNDTTRTSSSPRVGYVPFYHTFYGGSRGRYGGGSRGGRVGGVSRGGFGGIGGGHAAGS
jgi:hypothetical protein